MRKTITILIASFSIMTFSAFAKQPLTIQPRIAHGHDIVPTDYPSFITIEISHLGMSTICGGTLIAPQWVLTAAHCLKPFASANVIPVNSFKVGLYPNERINGKRQVQRWVNVKQAIAHPNHVAGGRDKIKNDMGLLQLSQPVSAPTAVLNANTANLVGQQGIAVGLGAIKTQDINIGTIKYPIPTFPDKLQAANLPIIDPSACKKEYPDQVDEKMLCAGVVGEQGANVCLGDSGGPLFINRGGQQILAALTNGGYQCGKGYPSNFTDVRHFKSFITQHVNNAVFDNTASIFNVSGTWYDPTYNGSGFNMAEFSNGLFAYFYGYKGNKNGEAQWLLTPKGIPTPIEKGKTYYVDLVSGFIGNGGSFTRKPTTEHSGTTNWGSMELTFNSCTTGVAKLNGKDGKLTHNIIKLANIVGITCSERNTKK